MNDAELAIPSHIAIATQPWVAERLDDDGAKAELYLVNHLQGLPNERLLESIPGPLSQDGLLIRRIEDPQLYAEPVAIATSVKIGRHLAMISGIPQKLVFLGFDFGFSVGEHATAVSEEQSAEASVRRSIIVSQESMFVQLSHYFEDKGYGELVHVGGKPYSRINVQRFLSEYGTAAGKRRELPTSYAQAADEPVWVVAELTNNHLGDIQRLRRMVQLAKSAGADLIKVQKRDVDSFYSKDQLDSYYWSPFGNTLGDYRRGVELTDEALEALEDECRRNDIHWFCSVLDIQSYRALERFSPQLIKIPSTISNHHRYHDGIVRNYQGGFVVSTGMTDSGYEQHVLDQFGHAAPLFLLQCTSAYPTPPEACQLAVIRHYRILAERHPNLIPGYSSHDSGSLGSMLAVAAGAKMIEKHVKLGDVEWVHFDKVAVDLENGEFAAFVADVRKAEVLTGREIKLVQDQEHHKYVVQENN
ncbi:hypothetical protein GCM10023212_08950 [Luteolibacter yonseiensis]